MRCRIFSIALILSSLFAFAQHDKPNIVLINVDDLGWRDLGFMGSKYYETPNIDRLAKEGMRFMNGYAGASNCAPSRACLLTGQWSPRHGIYTVGSSERGASKDRKLIPTQNTIYLEKRFRTFPEMLHNSGYQTIIAGKWHVSENPTDFGFDINIGGSRAGHPKSYFPPYGNVALEPNSPDQNLTDLIMDKTLEVIGKVESPFFLYYASYAVHSPIQPEKDLLDKYQKKEGWNGQENAQYATMVENIDQNIGRLIDGLKSKGLYENTLIVFTSDNGGVFGITNMKPLRAGKGSYYEGGIREPFVFVWPKHIEPNTVNQSLMTNLDLFPTFLAAVGIDQNGLVLDGENLLPVLLGKELRTDRSLFWHFPVYLEAYQKNNAENRDPVFRTRPGSAIRKGSWKLHYYFEDKGIELYNLSQDIGEKNDLAESNPEKREELLRELKQWWSDTQAPIPQTLNPEFQAK
ncbi:sulfatase [Marinilongibacter aquaticus]|uniref:sulfatase n=1 Tax=Marinilongibacter aquaticus TaxID=2975157 RepID=UPI0021BD7467|nr:sulfatase [Marinilongibacter aquaticus]UBM59716.1 sulfatase [Marinilongibacter aquaticus]